MTGRRVSAHSPTPAHHVGNARTPTHTYARRALTDPAKALFSRARLFSRLHLTQMFLATPVTREVQNQGSTKVGVRGIRIGCLCLRPSNDVVAPAVRTSTLLRAKAR